MTLDDIEDVLNISAEQFGGKGWGKSLFSDDLNKQFKYAYVLKQEITNKEKTIAFIIFMQTEGETGLEYNITNLAIGEKYKKLGYATSLLGFVKDFSKRNNIKKIWLEVRESNLPAIKLYKKSGFKTDYIRKNYYPNGENACVMSFDV